MTQQDFNLVVSQLQELQIKPHRLMRLHDNDHFEWTNWYFFSFNVTKVSSGSLFVSENSMKDCPILYFSQKTNFLSVDFSFG